MSYAIQLKGVTKRFPGIIANDHISFEVEKGEIHTLAGENGAGKSTLMNIIYGLYHQDEGEIYINEKLVKFYSSKDSIACKIGMVHQHFMLVPKLTVTENIILGQEVGSKLKVDRKGASAEIKKLSEQYGLNIDPDMKVSQLTVTQQQRVEILKILYREAEILIFDEPTAVLTPQEIEEFCNILLGLKTQGKTIVFISHKLEEVLKISDKITVIRHGKVIGTVNKGEATTTQITKMMVGRDVDLGRIVREEYPENKTLLELKDISYTNNEKIKKLKNISLTLRSGEVLGIAGVDGNGQEELVQIITGNLMPETGLILHHNRDITKTSIRKRKDNGISYIPEDRHKEGLVLEYSVAENLILGKHYHEEFSHKGFWVKSSAIQNNGKEKQRDFDIRCADINVSAGTLSGGNQQKIVIGRESYEGTDIIVAVQPTRGLDVGAVEFVQHNLMEQRNKGRGVMLFSLELDEILAVSDRIAVMYRGEISAIVDAESVGRQELGMLMLGANKKK